MIVTTSQNEHPLAIERAKMIASELNLGFIPRNDRSLDTMYQKYGESILVVNRREIKWYRQNSNQPFFFHPGLSVVRIKRLISGDNDIMIQTCQLQSGDHFLDCTLGLAADAIVASYAVGEAGRVVGLESEPMLAYLVRLGLKDVQSILPIEQATRRIEVLSGHHDQWLQEFPDKSFDVVYFDPMFREGIKESSSLKTLRDYANPSPISLEAVRQAERIARKRVVLKEHKNSDEWERLGFSPMRRENMDVTYGVIEV
ncbi:MAG TPA: class I SAM-dependent methyltransferase [Bacillota bacterium]|nr:class I SAM-dependent methyltransferase [Bacillota bacterium]